MKTQRLHTLTLAIGFAFEAAFLSILIVGKTASDLFFLKWYMGAALVAGALWLALLQIWRPGALPLKIIIVFAILFRVTLICVPATTSRDAFRYVWDGKALTQGINPYQYAPIAPNVERLRDPAVFPHINHPQLPTIYPPLAQLFFALGYRVGGDSLLGMKAVGLFAELVTLWLLWIFLKRGRDADPSWIVAYAWCPLPVMEFMTAAHMDVLGLPWMTLFYLAATERRPVVGALALAGATLIKLFPAILLPLLLVRVGVRKWPLTLLAFTLPVAAGFAPFMTDGVDPFVSLRIYSWNWQFNAPLFSGVETWLGDGFRARKVCLALFIVLMACWIVFRRRVIESAEGALFTFFSCATTVFPWYLTWLAPACVTVRMFPVLWLIVTSPLTYVTELEYRTSGDWTESQLVQAIEFLPIVGWLAWSGVRKGLRWRNERCNLKSPLRPAHSQ